MDRAGKRRELKGTWIENRATINGPESPRHFVITGARGILIFRSWQEWKQISVSIRGCWLFHIEFSYWRNFRQRQPGRLSPGELHESDGTGVVNRRGARPAVRGAAGVVDFESHRVPSGPLPGNASKNQITFVPERASKQAHKHERNGDEGYGGPLAPGFCRLI